MREITYSEAINEAVREEMRRDSSIVLLGQDIGEYGGTFGVYKGIFEEFGEDRVRDGPLSEAATVGVGIGLAINGMRAVVDIEFIDFSTLILDAVVNQAAKLRYFYGGKLKVPIVIRLPSATKLGLGAQHSQSLEAWFMHAPGLLIAMPSTPYDAHLLAPIQRVAGKDIPIPAGVLENRAFPSREELKDTARLLMGGS